MQKKATKPSEQEVKLTTTTIMQDVYQTVRLMSAPELVGGTKDFFGWKSRFGTVSGAKSMVMTLSMNWMHEASNGTSSETGDHGKDEPDVDEEKSKQAEPDVDKEKFEKVGPDVDEEKSEQDEPDVDKEKSEQAEPDVDKEKFEKVGPDVDKEKSEQSDDGSERWKSRKTQDEEVAATELCLASLTQDRHWEEIDGDPPNLMPGVNINMDNIPGRIQDFGPAC